MAANIITIPDRAKVKDIDLYIDKQTKLEHVSLNQYDTGLTYIRATVWDDTDQYIINSTDTIVFSAVKPDGNPLFNYAGIDTEGRILYEVTQNTSAVFGDFKAKFRLYNNKVVDGENVSTLLSTFDFKVNVAKSEPPEEVVISSPEFTALTVAITSVGDLINDMNEALAKDAQRNVWEDYNPLTLYKQFNKVVYEKSSYYCKQDLPSAGILPTNTTYWIMIASKGIDSDMLKTIYDPDNTATDIYSSTFTEAASDTDIVSGKISTIFGQIKKSLKTFRTAIGILANLATTAKNSLVDAINELLIKINNRIPKGDTYINVKDYGATGTGDADDLTAINNAISYAQSLRTNFEIRPTLYFPYAIRYAVSDTVNIPENINVIMDAPLCFLTQQNAKPLLVIGNTVYQNWDVYLKLQTVSQNYSDMSSEQSIGIKLINPYSSRVHVVKTEGTTIGVQVYNNLGVCDTKFHFGRLKNHKISLDMPIIDNGWMSNCQVHGMLVHNTQNFTMSGKRAIRAISTSTVATSGIETVSFYNIGVEDTYPVSEVDSSPIYTNCMRNCKFENAHIEVTNADYIAIFTKNPNSPYYVRNNVIELGYNSVSSLSIKDMDTVGGNYAKFVSDKRATLINSSIMAQDAWFYVNSGGTNYYSVKKWNGTTLGAATKTEGVAGARAGTGEIVLTGAAQCMVQKIYTDINKEFKISVIKSTSTAHKILLRCYDSGGNIITDIANAQITGGYWDAGYYAFVTEYTIYNDTAFKVSDNVKSVDVIICGDSAGTWIKMINMYSLNSDTATYFEPNKDVLYSMAIPVSTGTVGKVVYNASTTAEVGWRHNGTAWVAFS